MLALHLAEHRVHRQSEERSCRLVLLPAKHRAAEAADRAESTLDETKAKQPLTSDSKTAIVAELCRASNKSE